MSIWFRRSLVVSAVAIVASAAAYWFWPRPPLPQQTYAEAMFTRPMTIDETAASQFKITINGIDWLQTTPRVRCGDEVKLKAGTASGHVPGHAQKLSAVHREVGAGKEALGWHDINADWFVSTNQSESKVKKVALVPGTYDVRFYLHTFPWNPEKGLPVVVLVGQSSLVVLPPEDGSPCGVAPLEDAKSMIRVKVTD